MVAKLFLERVGRILASLECDEHTERLPFQLIGPADCCSFCNGRMRHQRTFHLGGADAVTGNVEHVVDPTDDPEITVLVLTSAVAREIDIRTPRKLAEVLPRITIVVAP